MEVEKEAERVPAKFKQLSYDRKEEAPDPWLLSSLGCVFEKDKHGFYPLSNFRMKVGGAGGARVARVLVFSSVWRWGDLGSLWF